VYVAEELLRSEGFAELKSVEYLAGAIPAAVPAGEVDSAIMFGGPLLLRIDVGDPIVILAGGHVKGKTVAVSQLGSPGHAFIAIVAAHVGLDVRKDIPSAVSPVVGAIRLLAEGRIDAVMLAAPDGQELRAQGIGDIGVNRALDRPWSQAFCCMVAGGRECVRRLPGATKRALHPQEAGMIKSTLQKIIAQCADWRFLNELRKERK